MHGFAVEQRWACRSNVLSFRCVFDFDDEEASEASRVHIQRLSVRNIVRVEGDAHSAAANRRTIFEDAATLQVFHPRVVLRHEFGLSFGRQVMPRVAVFVHKKRESVHGRGFLTSGWFEWFLCGIACGKREHAGDKEESIHVDFL